MFFLSLFGRKAPVTSKKEYDRLRNGPGGVQASHAKYPDYGTKYPIEGYERHPDSARVTTNFDNYSTLAGVLDEAARRFVPRLNENILKPEEKIPIKENYAIARDSELLGRMLESMNSRFFTDLYKTYDYKTGRRGINKVKQKGMINIINRARSGEFDDALKSYYVHSGRVYYENDAQYLLQTMENRINMDMSGGFFAKTFRGIENLFKREHRYAWAGM